MIIEIISLDEVMLCFLREF